MTALLWVVIVVGSVIVGRMLGVALLMLSGDHPRQVARRQRGLHHRHAYEVAEHKRTGGYDPLEVARLERECFGTALSEDAIKAEAEAEQRRRRRLGWADRAVEDLKPWREGRYEEEWDRMLRDNGLEEEDGWTP